MTTPILTDNFLVSDSEGGLIGSILAIGAVLGALPAGYIAKQIGIKKEFLIIAALFVIGWGGTIHHSLETILLGRFVGGVATGAVCVCVPIYVSSIASVSIRGILGSFFQVSFCFGILLVNLVGGCVPWADLSYYMIALPGAYFVALLFIPGIDLDNDDSSLDHETGTLSLWQQLSKRNNVKALIVGLGLVSFQQLSGVNAVIFYTGGIFSAAGSALSPNVSTVIVTGAQLVISVISAAMIEKFNRRLYLLVSSIGMGLSLLLLAAYFITKPLLPGVLPLVSLVLFFLTYCAGYGPLPWLMLGEIFSPEFKSVGCSVATTFNWLLVFGVTSVFPVLCSSFGEGYTFALFGAFNVAAVIFTYTKVPETRGKTSEQIQASFL